MSSRPKNSLIHFRDLNKTQITDIFDSALQFEKQNSFLVTTNQVAALIFFEASTRTRMSFEMACVHSGFYPMILDGKSNSSLEKGESLEDTVLNIAAMNPAVLIIRSDDSLDLEQISQRVGIPVLNAGWGKRGHPSQALLDAYTILRKKNEIENQRVLIVGDIRHSRVAASHFELSKILNYEVALCGPSNFLPQNSGHKIFTNLSEGLKWASVIMALRVQKERHSEGSNLLSYAEQYGINEASAKFISPEALVMHPGPINHGVEMDTFMIEDSRSIILDQVRNGIYIRQALLERALNGGPQ